MIERRNREAELSPLVSKWLRALGCSVYAEIAVSYGVIDNVGIRWIDESIVWAMTYLAHHKGEKCTTAR